MQYEARFPVHMPGLKVGGRSRPRNAVILRTTTIDIPHVASADAPLVLESKELIARSKFRAETYRLPPHYELKEQFRTFEGKFYRRVDLPAEHLEMGLEYGWLPLGPILRSFNALHDKMPIGTFHQDGLKRLYPKGINSVLNGNPPESDVRQALVESAELEVPEDYADAIRQAEYEFKKRSAEMMVCDGAVWVECDEPRLVVTFEKDRCNIKLYAGTNHEARYFHEELESTHDIYGTRMYFALSEIDKAKEFSKSLSPAFDVQADALQLSVHEPSAFSKPSIIANAVSAVRILVSGEKPDQHILSLATKLENDHNIDHHEVEMMLIAARRSTYDNRKKKALNMVLNEIQQDLEMNEQPEIYTPQSLAM